MTNLSPDLTFAYVRLSRADLRQPGSTEEKLANRAEVCKRIARENGLTLLDDHILVETGSASKLTTRPKMMELLQIVAAKKARFLITPYQDRLLRGDKRDEEDILDAFCAARVTLYSAEAAPQVFGPDYDETEFEMRAFLARNELRTYARRRKISDQVSLERARRTRAMAPYGYRYVPAQYNERGEKVKDARHVSIPEEIAIVREVGQRALSESPGRIAQDLNARGIPGLAVGRREGASERWHAIALHYILDNVFYVGYLEQRKKMVRGKKVTLQPHERSRSKVKGDWEPVWTEEEWERIQQTLRRRPALPEQKAPLTGILYNWCGHRMSTRGERYACHCGNPVCSDEVAARPKHKGMTIDKARLETYALAVLETVIEQLSPQTLPAPVSPRSRAGLYADLARLRRELRELQSSQNDMIERAAWHIQMFGEEAYRQAAVNLRAKLETAVTALADAEDEADAPDFATLVPLLLQVRERGVQSVWEALPGEDRRDLVRGVIARIDLQAPRNRAFFAANVTLHPWCAVPIGPLPDL